MFKTQNFVFNVNLMETKVSECRRKDKGGIQWSMSCSGPENNFRSFSLLKRAKSLWKLTEMGALWSDEKVMPH